MKIRHVNTHERTHVMALTPQQEKFCQSIADGMNQSDAYRAAYPKSQKWLESSVHSKASTMAADVRVSARVAQSRLKLEAKALWSREDSVTALKGVVTSTDKGGEIVSAVKELNAMHGFLAPTKHEIGLTVNAHVHYH